MGLICSPLQLCLLQLKSVCSSIWPTFRFLERAGTGDTELMGVVGSGFQAVRVVSPESKSVARLCPLLLCSASLNVGHAGAHSRLCHI